MLWIGGLVPIDQTVEKKKDGNFAGVQHDGGEEAGAQYHHLQQPDSSW